MIRSRRRVVDKKRVIELLDRIPHADRRLAPRAGDRAGEMITDLGAYLSLGIGRLLDSHKHDIGTILGESSTPLWVSRLSHVLSFLIDPVANQRVISAEFLQQLDHLRGLLLAQERQLQDEMLAVLGG